MLDLRLSDTHQDTAGTVMEIFAPLVLAEDTQGLGDGFVDALRADLYRVLDTLVSRQMTLLPLPRRVSNNGQLTALRRTLKLGDHL
jgi:hypothetical protein